jgi:retron-type reverse transcriptase
VVFLDFKAAFDVVDHSLLLDILRRRGCPLGMQKLIASLTFHHIRSRIVSDGEASDWFSRSRGVLQGSPLSPYLFNIFVDGLLEDLNDGATTVPRSLFYADDGTLLASSPSEIQRLLDVVAA